MSSKRRRNSTSPSRDNLLEESNADHTKATALEVDSKLPRPSQASSRSLVCSLPPCCAPPRRPTALGSLRELEAHYAKYHANICKEGSCRNEPGGAKIFPDARMLELHQTEYHDELAAIRNERGESIFACFLESCPRKFRTPKGRRLHLIDAHGYPKLYFFAITKHGIGGLLARFGEGATLIRKPWKPRAENAGSTKEDSEDDSSAGPLPEVKHSSNTPGPSATNEASSVKAEDNATTLEVSRSSAPQVAQTSTELDDLASSMKTLGLVPTSIRFGRGARRAGFVRRGAARGGASNVTFRAAGSEKKQE
ncbi:C2H2 type zinc finger protein [Ceratobasidium theobromae]|uniref:C2H2 type zinc finger protein n=1 Tax=Ceratobasidium theobromae TaxID=1582974 RepID=A0A5N5QRN9_9AGAM|nr:C2H2 type zinc finger protein [Ceratobasidium theobromae]